VSSGEHAFTFEIGSDIVERPFKAHADFLDIVCLDHQRRREHQPVSNHPQDQPVPFGSGVDASADAKCTVERNALRAVTHQLHAENEAGAAHVADQRVFREPAERRLQQWTETFCAPDDVDLLVDLLYFESDRCGEVV
jgi:hypothetical protein